MPDSWHILLPAYLWRHLCPIHGADAERSCLCESWPLRCRWRNNKTSTQGVNSLLRFGRGSCRLTLLFCPLWPFFGFGWSTYHPGGYRGNLPRFRAIMAYSSVEAYRNAASLIVAVGYILIIFGNMSGFLLLGHLLPIFEAYKHEAGRLCQWGTCRE